MDAAHNPDDAHAALVALGRRLKALNYAFHMPTPETHRRVLARAGHAAKSITDVFGWNRPFAEETLPRDLFGLLQASGKIHPDGGRKWKSTIRFSTLGAQLFLHSGFPTSGGDAVFFGPDTYRFARAITELARRFASFAPQRLLDIGTGSGAGGLHCVALFPSARVLLSDINPAALQFADINAQINDVPEVALVESDLFAKIDGPFDLIVANPPYLVDGSARTYRHGGGRWGCALAERILRESLSRLTPHGKLLLYTGTPVVDGVDQFLDAVRPMLENLREFHYEEIDPDVFGEELDRPPYTDADRIAVVMLLVDGKDLRR